MNIFYFNNQGNKVKIKTKDISISAYMPTGVLQITKRQYLVPSPNAGFKSGGPAIRKMSAHRPILALIILALSVTDAVAPFKHLGTWEH